MSNVLLIDPGGFVTDFLPGDGESDACPTREINPWVCASTWGDTCTARQSDHPPLDATKLNTVITLALASDNWQQRVWYSENHATGFKKFLRRLSAQDTLCGTAMCVAGFAAISVEQWEPVLRKNPGKGFLTAYAVRHPDTGVEHSISHVARKALGLTIAESDKLFSARIKSPEELMTVAHSILTGDFRKVSE